MTDRVTVDKAAQAMEAVARSYWSGAYATHDPDAECPWGMGEVDWHGLAEAALASARPVDDPAGRVRAELDDATRQRSATPGNPADGPYPATLDEVASEVVAWIDSVTPSLRRYVLAALDPPAAPEAEAPTCPHCGADARPLADGWAMCDDCVAYFQPAGVACPECGGAGTRAATFNPYTPPRRVTCPRCDGSGVAPTPTEAPT